MRWEGFGDEDDTWYDVPLSASIQPRPPIASACGPAVVARPQRCKLTARPLARSRPREARKNLVADGMESHIKDYESSASAQCATADDAHAPRARTAHPRLPTHARTGRVYDVCLAEHGRRTPKKTPKRGASGWRRGGAARARTPQPCLVRTGLPPPPVF